MKKTIALCLLIISLWSCSDDEEEIFGSKKEIEVITSRAVIGSEGGVTFYGSYKANGDKIIETGFEYTEETTFYNNQVFLITEDKSQTNLEYFVATGMEKDVVYYFRSFVRSDKDRIFGETLSFKSTGGAPPVIESISKEMAYLGDTLEVKGQYFKDTKFQTKVKLGDAEAPILFLSDTLIRCIIPHHMSSFQSDLIVKLGDRESSFSKLTLFTPVIDKMEPLFGIIGDTITLQGNHFDKVLERNKVLFGDVEAQIIEASRKEIKAIVPLDIEKGIETVKVKAQAQEIPFQDSFNLEIPAFKISLNSVTANQELLIEGINFHPQLDKNIIRFESVEADLISGDRSNLQIKVPLGPYPRRKAVLELQVLDMQIAYEIDLTILDKWVMVADDLPFRSQINNAVVAKNRAFVIAQPDIFLPEEAEIIYYLYEFNTEDYSWEKSDIPFSLDSGSVMESNNEKIYVYSGLQGNGFWEGDPITGVWTQKEAFPGEKRSGATHFSINGDIYIGLGAGYEPYSPITYGDFYKYSSATEAWTEIAPFTFETYFPRIFTSSFTINGIGYFGNGASNSGMVNFWSYHPDQDQWIRVADFSGPRGRTASFELDNYGYVTTYNEQMECWKYDQSSDQWIRVEDLGHLQRSRHFSFSINGKAYSGGGRVSSSRGGYGYDIYEYIP